MSSIITSNDHTTHSVLPNFLFPSRSADSQRTLASISNQFLTQNKKIFDRYGIVTDLQHDGRQLKILFHTGEYIGAFPLLSPSSGRYDYGMVIYPRFEWEGLGSMLGVMGWKIIPAIQNLPILPTTEKQVPRWVISSVVILRLEKLLHILTRKFETVESFRDAPHGKVKWSQYASKQIPRAKFLEVPCSYPDLQNNQDLLAAVHFVLRQQMADLESQRSAGYVVLTLIDKCWQLLHDVRHYPARKPTPRTLQGWFSAPLQHPNFKSGIQALEWSIESKGLAGLSSLQGLPWKMSMPEFFEGWGETIALKLSEYTGGVVRSGRLQETVTPISWDYPPAGSQKSLKPDVIIERPNETIIIDAKYKAHWYELQNQRWYAIEEEMREQHRNDLLQVLAYSTLFTTESITALLMYPCSKATWDELIEKGRAVQRASVYSGDRKITLLLSAIPMQPNIDEIAKHIAMQLNTHT